MTNTVHYVYAGCACGIIYSENDRRAFHLNKLSTRLYTISIFFRILFFLNILMCYMYISIFFYKTYRNLYSNHFLMIFFLFFCPDFENKTSSFASLLLPAVVRRQRTTQGRNGEILESAVSRGVVQGRLARDPAQRLKGTDSM